MRRKGRGESRWHLVYLAVAANFGTLLDLDKRADFGVISDLAAVQVYKVVYLHVPAELYVGRYSAHFRGIIIHLKNLQTPRDGNLSVVDS